jgi:precorrin-2 dehydrogenase/sirohydrochlorin ferrochelatase
MRTHPVFLRLEGRRCVVVGGDAAALPKALACRMAGADVVVIAESVTPGLAELARAEGVTVLERAYRDGDLAGAFVAYASVGDPHTVTQLRAEAARERVLLNVVDVPEACSFIAPAVLTRGELQLAVGTGGASPGLSARIRRDLEPMFGPEYEPYVAILGAVRRWLEGAPDRAEVLGRLVDSELLALVRDREAEAIDRLLARVAGESCSLARLGIALGPEG